MIAALFVDARGPYASMRGVDAWPIERDARLYRGPHAVVAHPPCQLWTNFAALNYQRWGGEHNRPGNDGGCFTFALASVRKWGGVLEHPAFSKAWPAFGLQRPIVGAGWQCSEQPGEWVCEVWQSAYGHPARKRTWIFCKSAKRPHAANWARNPGTHQVGWFDRSRPTLGRRAASLTPLLFARYLVSLAKETGK